jgi:pimeloyl-ACP methyl ester carboxylesterase
VTKSKVVEQGRLGAGLAYLRVGTGRPLVYLPGQTTHNRPPQGMDRWFQVGQLKPFSQHREVWWVQRRESLAPGTTMAEIARDYAAALRDRFESPVDVIGSSTGGTAGLQLAADHPEAVRRLVLLSSACRLGPVGHETQRSLAELLRQGRTRQANAQMMSMLAGGAGGQWLLAKLGWLLGTSLKGEGVSDMLVTIDAENSFDLTCRLPAITAPTLVIGGARDRYYGAEVFRETAAGLPRGQLLLYRDKGHFGTQTSRKTISVVLRFLDGQ